MAMDIAIWARAEDVAGHPDGLDFLQEHLGMNIILLTGPRKATPELIARNPLPPEAREIRGPGVSFTPDDSALVKAIEEAHKRGLKAWWAMQGWQGADRYGAYAGVSGSTPGPSRDPALISYTLRGQPVDGIPQYRFALEQGAHVLCPNNAVINDYLELAYVDAFKSYDLDGIYINHIRFQHPAFFPGLFICGCASCEEAAEELGYDFGAMRKGVLKVWEALEHLSAGRAREMARLSPGFADFLQLLGGDTAIIDWFNFRAQAVERGVARFTQAIHREIGRPVMFIPQAFMSTFSYLVGHRYTPLARAADAILPCVQHIGGHLLANFASFATLLCEWAPGLTEKEVLGLLYRLFGYDDLPMPQSIADFHLARSGEARRENPYEAELALPDFYAVAEREVARARLHNRSGHPNYIMQHGQGWPKEAMERLRVRIAELGNEGIVYQGFADMVPPAEGRFWWDEGPHRF